MSEKKIIVSGKEINYGNMPDKKLLTLYKQLIDRQIMIEEKLKNQK